MKKSTRLFCSFWTRVVKKLHKVGEKRFFNAVKLPNTAVMLRKVERTGQKFGLTLKLFFFAELILSQWRRWDEEPDCLTEKPQIFKLVAVFGLVFIFVDKYVRN